jgi:hypothetical protein
LLSSIPKTTTFTRFSLNQAKFASRSGRAAAEESVKERNKRLATYMLSIAIGVLGVSYAAVPLYKVFCQVLLLLLLLPTRHVNGMWSDGLC